MADVRTISSEELMERHRGLLRGDGTELALIDAREPTEFTQRHLLYAANLPPSHVGLEVAARIPRLGTPVVVCDDGGGEAAAVALELTVLGYTDTAVLDGGIDAWAAAGGELYSGINVPSKLFGELVEEHFGTPHVTATELARWLLSADMATARKSDGAVLLHGNRYWDAALSDALAGRPLQARKVVVRYDPQRLDRPVLVEDREGRRIARAEVLGRAQYFSKQDAKDTAKAKARLLKAAKAELELHAQLGVGAVADALSEAAASESASGADPAPASPQVEEILDNVLQFGGGDGTGEASQPDPDPDREAEEEMVRRREERLLQMAGLA